MRCPICDQKAMNCDCTPEERRQFSEIEDLQEEIARLRLTDAEREAVERAADWMVQLAKDRGEIHSAGYLVDDAATLRGLLARCAIGSK